MTPPWTVAVAAGLIAGPRIRVGLPFRGTDDGRPRRRARHHLTHLGMPGFRPSAGRASGGGGP